MKEIIREVEELFGYFFRDRGLLVTALTHSSYANENPGFKENNERLEFLGDAVLELCISEELYRRFPHAREGDLTSTRAYLVNEASLASIAREMGLGRYLLLGKGEEMQGGRERDANLCDAFEAILGAIFLDGGYEEAKRVILKCFKGTWPQRCMDQTRKDFKSALQEITQRTFKERPRYVLVESFGPEHSKSYRVKVELPTGETFEGVGSSIKRAEQMAAQAAIKRFKKQGRSSQK